MPHNKDVETSYGLEHKLAQSIEKVGDNLKQRAALKKQIIALRRQRRSMPDYPQEVIDWFAETEDEEEE